MKIETKTGMVGIQENIEYSLKEGSPDSICLDVSDIGYNEHQG